MLLISLRFLALMLAALTAGMTFAHVLERPAKMRYDAALYGTLQKTLYAYWGPPNVGALIEITAIAATLGLAWLVSDRASALWMTAGAATARVPDRVLRARRARQQGLSRGDTRQDALQLDGAARALGRRPRDPLRVPSVR